MSKQTRRQFLSAAGKTAAVTGIATMTGGAAMAAAAPAQKVFVHHVYFWLHNPDSQEDKAKLIAGLQKLAKGAKTIQQHHIGTPSSTNRDVIDRSYQVSWLLFFKNKAEQDIYQTDPAHLKFIEECSSVWKKVIVYDAEDI
ncbi:Stress responsive A/B Barrel Domain [Chitinophaga sp. YR627]|uniref:Dabb family protein n=1 Tax=Chitinophaga sp. YR627 TaxID=1881041 RepID=UPI0008ECAC2E|nr:Dabb family protein [Chitinophaga sp. YR627]SFO44403.1 Stress responsive A/B Barrel Domain [Chitinophaga sp. YR627]